MNTKFSGYCFYMDAEIESNWEICISAHLTKNRQLFNLMFLIFLFFFYSNVVPGKLYKWYVPFFTPIMLAVCVRAIARIKWRRLYVVYDIYVYIDI